MYLRMGRRVFLLVKTLQSMRSTSYHITQLAAPGKRLQSTHCWLLRCWLLRIVNISTAVTPDDARTRTCGDAS